MDIVRDLVRDLVGILFPGAVVVLLTWGALWSVLVLFFPLVPIGLAANNYAFLVPLIFSYIVGQFLRMKRLEDIENKCTEMFRKRWSMQQPRLVRETCGEKAYEELKRREDLKHKLIANDVEWRKATEDLDKLEQIYLSSKATPAQERQRQDLYREYVERFDLWETFPYPYRVKARRVLQYSTDYNRFFEKYDREGITKFETFFIFCKAVAFQHSPTFKEELLRQEALVRMFAGLYYATRYGLYLVGVTLVAHLSLAIATKGRSWIALGPPQLPLIAGGFCLALVTLFGLINREILRRLLHMRAKELNLAHDAFYLICADKGYSIGLSQPAQPRASSASSTGTSP